MGNTKSVDEIFSEKCHKELFNCILDEKFVQCEQLINHVDKIEYICDGTVHNKHETDTYKYNTYHTAYFNIIFEGHNPVTISYKFKKNNLIQCVLIKYLAMCYSNKLMSNESRNNDTNWSKQYLNIINLLITKGNDINYKDDNGNTITHIISMYNNMFMAKNLINSTDHLKLCNKDSKTPLLIAITNEYDELASYLTELELTHHESKELIEKNDTITCIVCMENARNILLEPCKHAVLCQKCSQSISVCPICKTNIITKLQIFIT